MNMEVTREDRLLRENRRKAERRRRSRMVGLGIAIPTLITLIYYAFIARPEYLVTMKFIEQGVSGGNAPDLLSSIGIPATNPQSNDGHILVDYVESPEMVATLRKSWRFDDAYRGPTLDPVGYIPKNAVLEDATNFWDTQVKAVYDSTSNVIQVDVLAFSPQDAVRLANGVLAESQRLVNSLNNKVFAESINVAQRQVDQRTREYNAVRDRVVQLKSGSALTADTEAQAQVAQIGALETQLASARVDQAAARAQFQPNSPQMKAFDDKIASLETQRAQVTAQLTAGPGHGQTARDVTTQAALLDYDTAQKNLYAAQASLQQAISTQQNQRRYLVTYQPPTLPETSNYWSRYANVLAIALFSALLIGVGALSYSVIKDHLE